MPDVHEGKLIAHVRRVTCSDLVGPQPAATEWVRPARVDLHDRMFLVGPVPVPAMAN